MLYVLLGATGMRVGEALGIEIDKHLSDSFSRLLIRQKVWNGRVQSFLKTKNGVRDIDMHPSVAEMLKKFAGAEIRVFCLAQRTEILSSSRTS
jgi:integrase